MEEYPIVCQCEIIGVGASKNFPAVTRYVVRLENGSERYAYEVNLT